MEQQQAAVVFNNSEPKPNPKIWIKISYSEGYKGFKAWPEGTVKEYRKDAAELIIARGIAVETEAPEGANISTIADTGEAEGAEEDPGETDEDTADQAPKNKTGKNRKK